MLLINHPGNEMVIVSVYGFWREEMSISSVLCVTSSLSDVLKDINKVVYLMGSGDSFILPETRLRFRITEFFSGKIDGYIMRKFEPVSFKLGRICEADNTEKMICQINKIGTESVPELFSYLSIDEVKARKKQRVLEVTDKAKKVDIVKKKSSKRADPQGPTTPTLALEKIIRVTDVSKKVPTPRKRATVVAEPDPPTPEDASGSSESEESDAITSDDEVVVNEKDKHKTKSRKRVDSEEELPSTLTQFITQNISHYKKLRIDRKKYTITDMEEEIFPEIYIEKFSSKEFKVKEKVDGVQIHDSTTGGELIPY